ncbi:hypothetical protein DUZ99_01965 [Xylanibacillus composti]|uniref:YqbQ/XkdQ domain-containing protein n=1 Tax=Xylanibacillus composti TaxID=1572762 RepID=A0A8J4H6V2_9BACL|nr:hypothetical protein [Xylanibacillus composti]MDT9723760.1 hypothetical protein [Xylanibacillus composti]GIQ70771.1 hypothetical protein XYCOK13_35950 [Xylanibacillus composti]
MLEIIIDNRDGNVWNVAEICSGLSWKTSRIGRAGSCEITLIKNAVFQEKNFNYNNGDILSVRHGQHKMFYGYIFSVDSHHDKTVKITAYDQLRYLMANDSGVFEGATATEIIRKFAGDFQLTIGELADTRYKMDLVESDKRLMDIITTALDKTMMADYGLFVLYDDYGQLTLRNTQQMIVNLSVGDSSLLLGYSLKSSIDNDTYNQVKVVQDNENTGRRDVYIERDSANIAKWGLLQLYQVADRNMNQAQIEQAMRNLLLLKNQEERKLRLDALGDIRVRAGCYLNVMIEEFGFNQNVLVDECTHKFDGHVHTMQLEVRGI